MERFNNLGNQIRDQKNIVALIGSSNMINGLEELAKQSDDANATVLIQGESGVGKEVVARFLHQNSFRRQKLFVKVNCAAISPRVLESELFGQDQGDLYGKQRRQPGRFELAHQGTLFLEEVGEIYPTVQSKILQVLEQRKFTRLGGKREIQADVRMIVSTSKNLKTAVKAGDFRSDLYDRISAINIVLPPLRERKSDVPSLCRYFLQKYSNLYKRSSRSVSKELMRLFLRYNWPGNVQELENTIRRMVAMDEEGVVAQELFQAMVRSVSEGRG